MPDLKMLNSTKYLYKLTFIKCSYKRAPTVNLSSYQIVHQTDISRWSHDLYSVSHYF